MTGEWLVIASVCDCPGIGVTVMDAWAPGSGGAGSGEMTATGPDWRPLAKDLALKMHRETGLPIRGTCATVIVRDREQHRPLWDELTDLVYATADEATQGNTITKEK